MELRDPVPMVIAATTPMESMNSGFTPSICKTSQCHSYWQTRDCTLGSACNFYHSESERRKPGAGYRETSDKIENISQNINSTKRNGVKEDRLVLEELETSKDIEEMSGAASRAGSTLRSRRG